MALSNSATINANQTNALTLQISNGATNTGTLEATSGGTLIVNGGIYANAGGTILNNASTLVFQGASTINGGTITQTGAGTMKLLNTTINTAVPNSTTGIIEVIGGGNTIAGALTNPAGGQVKIDNGSNLTMAGSSINNAGAITLNSIAYGTQLLIGAANVTLSGSGTLTMSNSLANSIQGVAAANKLTNQQTIQGAGNIGAGQMALSNSGTINANQTNALTLQISNGATNTGTLEATSGGTLIVNGGTYANAGGTILNNASTLVFQGASTINGGTITQNGAGTMKLINTTLNTAVPNSTTGIIEVIGGGNTIAGTLTNPAGGQVKIDNGGNLTMGAGSSISNAGAITLNSIGNGTELIIGAANVTLSGSGTLTMSNSTANLITGSAGTDMLTNQQTIQGAGNIGFGAMALSNSGTIDANQTNALTLQISNGATNTGTLEATSGGTLIVNGGT